MKHKRAPWWAPFGYTRGAWGYDDGKSWGIAFAPARTGLPTIVMIEGEKVAVEFPWWARGVRLRRLHMRRLVRAGVFR